MHVELQEVLAARALSRHPWPSATPKPWAWGVWWRGVACIGTEPSLRTTFGAALYAACKVEDIKLETITGDPIAVSEAIRVMLEHASAKGKRLRLRTDHTKDVLEAIQQLSGEKGEARMAELKLGSLPVVGFAVLMSFLATEPAMTALELSKNLLSPDHAEALAHSCTRGRDICVSRLGLSRNGLGGEGVARLATALVQGGPSPSAPAIGSTGGGRGNMAYDLDLSHNGVQGLAAVKAIASLIRNGRLSRLELTSNPMFGRGGMAGTSGAAAGSDPSEASRIGLECLKLLCDALLPDTTLRELHLRDTGIETSAGAPLGQALGGNRGLQHLSLWKGALCGAGGKALMSGMMLNVHLVLLDLRSNRLDDEAGLALATYLQRRNKLATLLISDNELGPDSGKGIAKAWAENNTLASLDARGNRFDADTVKALRAARSSAARKQGSREGAPPVELLIDEP